MNARTGAQSSPPAPTSSAATRTLALSDDDENENENDDSVPSAEGIEATNGSQSAVQTASEIEDPDP